MSLRTRLIGLLVAAIVAVVVLAAGVTALVMDGPDDGRQAKSAAEAIVAVARLIDGSPERARQAGLALLPPPRPAAVRPGDTREIADALGEMLASQRLTDIQRRSAAGGHRPQAAKPQSLSECARWPGPS